MNHIVATKLAVVAVRVGYTVHTHRKQMKKLRAEREFWNTMHDRLTKTTEKPPIYVVCERLA